MTIQSINMLDQIKDVLHEIFVTSNFPDDQVAKLTEKSVIMLNKRILLNSIAALKREQREVIIQQIKSLSKTEHATEEEQQKLINSIAVNLDQETFATIITSAIEELIQPLLIQFKDNASEEQIQSLKAKLASVIHP